MMVMMAVWVTKPKRPMNKARKVKNFLCLVLGFCFGGVVITGLYAEVYHWVDEYGQNHFGDQPPSLKADVKSYDQINDYELENVVDVVPSEQIPIAKPLRNTKPVAKTSKNHQIEKKCERLREQLKKNQYYLRSGYKEPRGNQLRQKRRFLTSELHKNCS